MNERLDLGWLWHALAGAILTLAWCWAVPRLDLASWAILAAPPALAAFGIARELWQHRDDPDPMNAHRWLEGLAWGVGSAVVAGIVWVL